MGKISIDTPLNEITIRKYEKPNEDMSDRDLVRKLCLSLGLLQPGDSRDVIVDVLQVMLVNKKEMTSKEIENATIENRNQHKLELLGIAPSNIRRQILRLRDLFIVEKVKNNYRIKENSLLSDIFIEDVEKYYLQSILSRVKEFIEAVDKRFLIK